jgi:maleate cis-trans isomerase
MWILDNSVSALETMNKEVETCAKYLASAAVEVIAYACTAGSFVGGADFDERVRRRISEASGGIPAVPTSSALLQALRLLRLRKLSVATPYTREVNARLWVFLEGNGFHAVNLAGQPHADSRQIGDDLPEDIFEVARQHCSPEADGMLLSCTNWRAMEVADQLEKEIRRPVVTSNQATIWATFQSLGLTAPIQGFGSLLAGPGIFAPA